MKSRDSFGSSSPPPLGLAFLLAALLVLLAPRLVFAHANLAQAQPAPGSVLAETPMRVTLKFTEPIEPAFSDIRVLDSAGNQVDGGDSVVDPGNPTKMSVSLKALEQDIYTVAWRNLSAVDGHAVRGSFTFSIGQGLAVPEQPAPSQPLFQSPLEPILRWLTLLGALALVGGLSFYLLVVEPPMESRQVSGMESGEPALRDYRALAIGLKARIRAGLWIATGVLAVAEVGRLLVQTATLHSIPVYQTLGPLALTVLASTDWGHLWLWRAALLSLAVAIMGVSVLLARRGIKTDDGEQTGPRWDLLCWWLALAIGTVILLTYSLASHGAALTKLRAAGAFTDYLHLLASAFWVGGLFHFVLGLPIFRSLSPRDQRAALSVLVPRFSTLAIISVATLTITGLYSAWAMVGTDIPAYTQTPYGLNLLVKIVLVAALLVLAALNLLWVRPGLARGLTRERWLRPLVVGEAILAVLVLLAVGFLTSLEPARQVAAREGLVQPGGISFQDTTGVMTINLEIEPGLVGPNKFLASLRDRFGEPIPHAEVSLGLRYLGANLGESSLSLVPQHDGTYVAEQGSLSIAGPWQVEVTIRDPGFFDALTAFQFSVTGRTATVSSGEAPTTTGRLLFGVELGLLGLLFLATGLALGGWWRFSSAALMSSGTLAALFGVFFVVDAVLTGMAGGQVAGNPFPPDERSVAVGKQLYTQNCLPCHGIMGKGDGPLAEKLNPKPFDLSVHVPFHSDAQLYNFVSKGVKGTAMPVWEDRLSPEEIWHIINYIKTFAPQER